MEMIILTISLTLSLSTKSITHPISFMGVILTQAISICVLSSLIVHMPWLAIVLFLIFLGGVMVLFIYMSSLASNENFLMNYKEMIITLMFMLFMMLTIAMLNQPTLLFSENKSLIVISTLYTFKFQNLYIVLIMYLLFTLFVVSEIIKKNKAPMRSMK